MGKRKSSDKKTIPRTQEITPKEKIYQLLFDFAYYLENMDRAPVGGATELLRQFLKKREEVDKNQ